MQQAMVQHQMAHIHYGIKVKRHPRSHLFILYLYYNNCLPTQNKPLTLLKYYCQFPLSQVVLRCPLHNVTGYLINKASLLTKPSPTRKSSINTWLYVFISYLLLKWIEQTSVCTSSQPTWCSGLKRKHLFISMYLCIMLTSGEEENTRAHKFHQNFLLSPFLNGSTTEFQRLNTMEIISLFALLMGLNRNGYLEPDSRQIEKEHFC